MAITKSYTLLVKNGSASLDKDIYLTAGDNVKLSFRVVGVDFDISKCTGTSISVLSEAGKIIDFQSNSTIYNGVITLNITSSLIDEVNEMGTYAMQVTVSDSEGSKVTLPIISNQFHVKPSLVMGGNTINVGSSAVNKGHVALGDELDIFKGDKSYNTTTWRENDVISSGKLNKIENALTYLMDNDVIFIRPVSNRLTMQIEHKQASEISQDTLIQLPDMTSFSYANMFLLLNCTSDVKVTFRSSADTQELVKFVKGYHVINLIYYTDWIITC